jgi:AcrR family transcriptional regulator
VTAQGEATRKRLLDCAERLFAERGILGVSLREVNAAAGQRNNAALHYHFGDRSGLLRAIAERHLPRLAARQQELLAAATRAQRLDDVRTLVEIIVRPSAEYIEIGPSERAWLRIAAELGTRPQTAPEEISTAASTAAWDAGARLLELLTAEHGMPREFAIRRIWTAMEVVMHAVGSRARFEDAAGARRPAVPLGLFIEDLLDMTCAALTAAVSEPTRRLLGEGETLPR